MKNKVWLWQNVWGPMSCDIHFTTVTKWLGSVPELPRSKKKKCPSFACKTLREAVSWNTQFVPLWYHIGRVEALQKYNMSKMWDGWGTSLALKLHELLGFSSYVSQHKKWVQGHNPWKLRRTQIRLHITRRLSVSTHSHTKCKWVPVEQLLEQCFLLAYSRSVSSSLRWVYPLPIIFLSLCGGRLHQSFCPHCPGQLVCRSAVSLHLKTQVISPPPRVGAYVDQLTPWQACASARRRCTFPRRKLTWTWSNSVVEDTVHVPAIPSRLAGGTYSWKENKNTVGCKQYYQSFHQD